MKRFMQLFLLLILCAGQSANLFSQGINNNGGGIVIQSGAVVYIEGTGGIYKSGTGVSDGSLDIDGNLYMDGDWINNNTGGDGLANVDADGTVRLYGAAQNIGGTRSTRFENLSLEGTGIKMLTGIDSTRVNGILALGDDTLSLNVRKIIIQNAATGAITRTSGYILSESENSKIQWNTDAALQVYVFPFGFNGTYIPFTFNKTTATATNISISTWNTNTDNLSWPSSTGSPDKTLPYDTAQDFFIDRWWTVKPVPDLNVTGELTFVFRNPEEITGALCCGAWPVAEPVSYHWNSWLGGWESIDAVATANSVKSTWTYFSGGGGGKKGGGPVGPLPIELLSFDAKYNEKTGDVDLEWVTASEINNDYFTVERSVDAVDFEKVVNVPGAGNSTQILYYDAVDEDPYTGVSYYRLKQTDYDGKYEYSKIVAVTILSKSDLFIHPNPANDNLTLLFSDEDEDVSDALIEIFDAQGKLIYSKNHETSLPEYSPVSSKDGKGIRQINISLSSFSQGMYFITFTTHNRLYKAKFVKEE